ncbi:SHOCT domain-containing protein [Acuticoccus sp. I52.16.1]|uniref:SHOCT domain-containing protein n=1 Tax=Acuticoccus sp. I52.16.1 TaxID=2928472 RepID=UPI001FD2D9D9|nr:SHOCT domain-containing protein [Acuticoccus sp. I52.16.1]UOM37190.1 SHOCT domain-containing protein [Acuticoccus sp. I52.16.1]
MSDLTDDARRTLGGLAMRYSLPASAVEEMARAVARGGGTMAQFNIPELGGSGQWMAGGMTMVGDMFNHGLKAQVDGLCAEIVAAMAGQPFFRTPQTPAGSAWWPAELGQPSSSGGQNSVRYAYFPQARRIVVDTGDGGPVIVLDTLDHNIGGFGQQQSGGYGDPFSGVTFSSQYGQFALSSLPRVTPEAAPAPAQSRHAAPDLAPDPAPAAQPEVRPEPMAEPAAPSFSAAPSSAASGSAPSSPAPVPGMAPGMAPPRAEGLDILATIERLAALRDAGALTEEEFVAKKTELLGRL